MAQGFEWESSEIRVACPVCRESVVVEARRSPMGYASDELRVGPHNDGDCLQPKPCEAVGRSLTIFGSGLKEEAQKALTAFLGK